MSEADSQRVETAAAAETIRAIVDNLGRVVHAPDETLRLCVLCLVGEGHLILEDFPGVGKTMLAKALARSLDVSFSRMQFTPDLLPSDVTGVNVFNQRSNEFEFRPGPVFANLLLVDEINRASPKTQAALLECMQEQQVTTDGVTNELDRPFMVMATQNPIEYEGTYPLPEAQLDRFTMRIAIGYPPLAEEAKMLTEQTADPPLDALEPVADAADAIALADEAKAIFVEESLNSYVVALLRATRGDSRLYLGASPRAGIALAPGREGARARRRAQLPRAGRCEGGGGPRARAPADPCARGPLDRAERGADRPGDARQDSGPGLVVLTRRGRFIFALGFGVYLAAWAFGSKPLYPVATGLLLAVAVAWVWVRLADRPFRVSAWLGRPGACRGRRRADRRRALSDRERHAGCGDARRAGGAAR